ncbi:NIF3 protein [Staphylococcus piscifermentans]|uniref:GTP cyclohydrolase 1 type 2 homolog n=1 Tax=Staphylococcus piscifermentans TaxID=70258 RepID=A0A239U4D8_9STAP|nr:Nif3-like dinuclear metal center hexameric protein [Staphylococcus piscifermentans]RTX83064.1 Nif3-like dinuclear metal center hexameric protein [Staphylococcus piscifermentans]GEP84716.1 GTP cyclohydrolase 1 type 2 [Staphylococcus piscifermentans]SNV03833.1 NIF3 protein [Staphylococcus piscifermentans]
MKTSELLNIINQHVPFSSAKEWDNVGLLIGDKEKEVTGILTTLDCTAEIVDEAINNNVNTIIAHHPLIFKGISNVNEGGYGTIIRRIIQHDIQLIALHTNLDVYQHGVNAMLAQTLGVNNTAILEPQFTNYYKVQVFIPKENAVDFKEKMSQAGFASEGNYEHCFFSTAGEGQFKPVGEANPHIGSLNEIESVSEIKIEFMIQNHQRHQAEYYINELHPYETPVYDFIPLTKQLDRGLGVIGSLKNQVTLKEFALKAKEALNLPSVRFTGNPNSLINTVAIIGGSGIGFEKDAINKGADVFVTGDIKHHDALDAKTDNINLVDINHYSEYVMKEGLKHLLQEWLNQPAFKIIASDLNTDPFSYV